MALTSLAVAGGLFAVNHLPAIFFAMVHASGDRTWQLFLSQGVLSGAVILLPTLGMGAALPLAISGWRAETNTPGRAVGGIYAANTLGSILGSVLAGFVILPWLGASGSIRLGTSIGLLVAIVLLLSERRFIWTRRLLWTGGLTGTLGALLL